MKEKNKKILVLCTGNSCRSQMAEGWLRKFYGDRAEIFSAGVEAHGLNLNAVRVMKEAGVDISNHTSDTMEKYLGMEFDLIITVCDNAAEKCPIFPGKGKKIHKNFPDPANAVGSSEEVIEEYRRVRDMLKDYCQRLVQEAI